MNISLNDLGLFQSVSLTEKFNFYEYLSVMLDWGVSISEALVSVQTKIRNQFFKQKLSELATFVSSGDSLSRSMKKIPQIFSAGEVAMIESWETMWKLSESLWHLSENLRKSHDLRSKIQGALTYPAIIFIFLIAAIIIVLTYVIPAVSQLFETSDTELPFATIALVASSDFIIERWYILLLLIATALMWLYAYKNTESWKIQIDYFLLQLPLFWKVRKNYMLAMFATNLGTLIASWVTVVKALNLSAKSLDDSVYEAYISQVTARVTQWEKIVPSLEAIDPNYELFSVDFLQLLSVGEKTASLDTICKKIATQYTREVDYALARMTKWIEPLAILVAWVFVLWFAFAIFGAILKVTQTVS